MLLTSHTLPKADPTDPTTSVCFLKWSLRSPDKPTIHRYGGTGEKMYGRKKCIPRGCGDKHSGRVQVSQREGSRLQASCQESIVRIFARWLLQSEAVVKYPSAQASAPNIVYHIRHSLRTSAENVKRVQVDNQTIFVPVATTSGDTCSYRPVHKLGYTLVHA